jgi:hypothetical protein
MGLADTSFFLAFVQLGCLPADHRGQDRFFRLREREGRPHGLVELAVGPCGFNPAATPCHALLVLHGPPCPTTRSGDG